MKEKIEEIQEVKSKPAGGAIILKNNQNASIDLQIGRVYYSFSAYEEKQVPRSVIEHRDFTPNMKKYFTVKEK